MPPLSLSLCHQLGHAPGDRLGPSFAWVPCKCTGLPGVRFCMRGWFTKDYTRLGAFLSERLLHGPLVF